MGFIIYQPSGGTPVTSLDCQHMRIIKSEDRLSTMDFVRHFLKVYITHNRIYSPQRFLHAQL